MALENLRKSLVQEAEVQARKLIDEARKRAEKVTDEAMEKAAKARKESREKADALAEAESNERISSAELKGKRLIAEAMDRKMQEAMEKVWQEFAKTPKSGGYEKILRTLISDAEKELGAKSVVHVNAQDAKLARKISKNVAAKPADMTGGAVVTTADGRISIDNSLESIFEQRREEAKKVIFSEMFSKGK